MNEQIKLLPESQDDLTELYKFYENQAEGLGEYCIDVIFAELDRLKFFAGIHPKLFNYHRCLTPRFPVSIYYKIVNQDVIIAAILDNRTNPQKSEKRLNK